MAITLPPPYNNAPIRPADVTQTMIDLYNVVAQINAGLSPVPVNLSGPGGAALIGTTPSGGITSTTVQASLNELDTKKVPFATLAASGGATLVGNTPSGGISSTTAQAAINELDVEKTSVATLASSGGAALVGNTPSGNISSTTVQAAVNELDSEKTSVATLAASGGAALVGNTPAGNISATTVQAALNELDTEKASLAALSASSGSALIGWIQNGTGAQSHTEQDKLRERVSVFDFMTDVQIADVKAGTLLQDVTAAINATITSLGTLGGDVIFPPGKYLISGTIVIGNGTTGNVWSTRGAVRLYGMAAMPGIGVSDPLGGVSIHSSFAGDAISVHGPLAGWGIENIFINITTTSTSAKGISLFEAQYGTLRNVVINNCFGISFFSTTYGSNNTGQNVFSQLSIFMPAGGTTSATVGVKLTGASGSNDTATNTFIDLFVQPNAAAQASLYLQFCDTNMFLNTVINVFNAGVANSSAGVIYDFSINSAFPQSNMFYQFDHCNANTQLVGVAGALAFTSPNRIYGFSQDNGAVIPTVSGLPLTVERIKIAQNQTFFVSTSGNDSTGTGLVVGNPWQTVTKAWQMLSSYYDMNGYTATIQLANGTYTEAFQPATNSIGGPVVISGNIGNPSLTSFTNALPFFSTNGAVFTVKNLQISGASIVGLLSDIGGSIQFSNVTFAACTAPHILAQHGGTIKCLGNYTITGGATFHWQAVAGGNISVDSVTITIIGTPAFSSAFATSNTLGMIEAYSDTFTGAATGVRFVANGNGVINTNGGGATYLPGNAAGSTATGGQYL